MNAKWWVLPVLLAAMAGGAFHQAAALRGKYVARRSPIIYPAQSIALRMNHAHPAHRALKCVQCHTNAGTSRQARDVLIPKETACISCHNAQTRSIPGQVTASDQDKNCGFCHVGYGSNPDTPRWVPASIVPTPRLRFSHARHVKQGMRCLTCHQGITESAQGTREHLPTMRQCFECHGSVKQNRISKKLKKLNAPSRCSTCHLTLPDGRLRTQYPEGWLNPPRWLFGMHHDQDFIVRHRWVGADQGSLCESCHTEKDCLDCHDSRVRPLSIHPNDFLSTHAQLSRREGQRCTSCHVTQSFCAECHARIGISPLSAPESRGTGRFHPPPEQWVSGPALHAVEARRSLSTCVSCHAERDCVSCHGGMGIGAGISPHPPGFAAKCRESLRANDRACRTCHLDVTSLCP